MAAQEATITVRHETTDDARAAVEQQLMILRTAVTLAQSPTLSPSAPASELPLGIPASYRLDLRTYDPLSTAARLHLPMFFSQGGRDGQVPPSELQG